MALYESSGCTARISRYIDSIVHMERLRDKVQKEHEEAPGRLRDSFTQLPGDIQALTLDEDLLMLTARLAEEGVGIIDTARFAMMAHKTKEIDQYLPSYRQDLEKVITRMEQVLFSEAIEAAGCLCEPEWKQVQPLRFIPGDLFGKP